MLSQLRKNAEYFKYIAKHKWFVLVECTKLGIPLRGLLHDVSKFLPDEWFPYKNFFYGEKTDETKQAFDEAWLRHIHRNPHHWQNYLLCEDSGKIKILEMPLPVLLEMIADWRGVGKAQGFDSVREWYKKNKDVMVLHQRTRVTVEHFLRQAGELD